MKRNRSNFQILLDCVVLNGIKKILLYHIDLFCVLRHHFGTLIMIWPKAPNLGFCPQIWVFNAFLGFSSEDLGF